MSTRFYIALLVAITLAITATAYGLATIPKFIYHTSYMTYKGKKILVMYPEKALKKLHELQPGSVTIIPFVEETIVTENTKFTLYAVALRYGEGPISNYPLEFKVYCNNKLIVDRYVTTDKYGLAKLTITTPSKAGECWVDVCHNGQCVGEWWWMSYFAVTNALSIPPYFKETKDNIRRTYIALIKPVTGTPYNGILPITVSGKRETLYVKNGVTKISLDLHRLGSFSISYQGLDLLHYDVYPSLGTTMPTFDIWNFYGRTIKLMILLFNENFTALSGVVTLTVTVDFINGSLRTISNENVTVKNGIGFATITIPSELMKNITDLFVSVYYAGLWLGSFSVYLFSPPKPYRPPPPTPYISLNDYCSSNGVCTIDAYLYNGTKPMPNQTIWIYTSWGFETALKTNKSGEVFVKVRAPLRYFIGNYFIVVASRWTYTTDSILRWHNVNYYTNVTNNKIYIDLNTTEPTVLSYEKIAPPWLDTAKVIYTEILNRNTTIELPKYNNYGIYCVELYFSQWSAYLPYCYAVLPLKLIYETPSIEYTTSGPVLTFRVLNTENRTVPGAKVCVLAYYTADIPYKGKYVEASLQMMAKCGVTNNNGEVTIRLPKLNFSNARNVVLNYYAVASANGYISNFTSATVQIINVSLPDLTVENLTIVPRYPVNGDLVKAMFEICNIGTKNASDVEYQVLLNNEVINESTISLVAAGECIPVTVSLGKLSSGYYTVQVIVNPYNTIREVTTENNVAWQAVQVFSPSSCIIRILPSSIFANITMPLKVELYNCPWVKSINITLSLNGVPVKVKNVTAGPGVRCMNGSLSSVIKNNVIEIEVKGRKSCGNFTTVIAYVYVNASKTGTLTVKYAGSLMDAEGRIFKTKVQTSNITVKKVLECDFNLNGRLDVGDVVLLLRILVGKYHSIIPCDLNHNGRLDIGDAVLLLRKLASI
ncbi:MAG: hypothetical protein GXO23_06845 [Crenarchaeota archaeon]|nr:hypothetical protein [Thermoproteota archaeon]